MVRGGLLELSPGAGTRLNGVCWTVEEILPQAGRVVLKDADGEVEHRSVRWLMHHPDARPLRTSPPVAQHGSTQAVNTAELSEDQLTRARLRAEHVMEAETGFRMGHPSRALPASRGRPTIRRRPR